MDKAFSKLKEKYGVGGLAAIFITLGSIIVALINIGGNIIVENHKFILQRDATNTAIQLQTLFVKQSTSDALTLNPTNTFSGETRTPIISATLLPVTLSPTHSQTSTFTPSRTVTATFTPTQTEFVTEAILEEVTPTPTLDPIVFRGLAKDCISGNYWFPALEQVVTLYHGCWNFENWGISPKEHGLIFLVDNSVLGYFPPPAFYTLVNKDQVEITFRLQVDELDRDLANGKDGVLAFGFGPNDQHGDNKGSDMLVRSGRFISIRRWVQDGRTFIGPVSRIRYPSVGNYFPLGNELKITFKIDGALSMIVEDADSRLVDEKVTLPPAAEYPGQKRVFWFYYLVTNPTGRLNATVTDFMIVEK